MITFFDSFLIIQGVVMSTQSVSCCANWLNYVPLISPAVKKNSCETDDQFLYSRIQKIFCAAVACFVIAVYFPAIAVYSIFLGFSLFLLIPANHRITKYVADKKAIDEYLHKDIPSVAATSRILQDKHLAKTLIMEFKKKKDGSFLHKLNDAADSLFDHISENPESFEVLVREIDFKNLREKKVLENLLKSKNSITIEFVLSKELV